MQCHLNQRRGGAGRRLIHVAQDDLQLQIKYLHRGISRHRITAARTLVRVCDLQRDVYRVAFQHGGGRVVASSGNAFKVQAIRQDARGPCGSWSEEGADSEVKLRPGHSSVALHCASCRVKVVAQDRVGVPVSICHCCCEVQRPLFKYCYWGQDSRASVLVGVIQHCQVEVQCLIPGKGARAVVHYQHDWGASARSRSGLML